MTFKLSDLPEPTLLSLSFTIYYMTFRYLYNLSVFIRDNF